jgi:hypothetical protein
VTIIVETGAGVADAESFASVAFASDYHRKRGNAAWDDLDTADKEAKLRIATDFMEQEYREQWAGCRVSASQALSWPRYEVPMKDAPGGSSSSPGYYPFNTVPALVSQACALLALRSIDGDLSSVPDVAVKREKAGPVEVEYFQPVMPVRAISGIAEMLRPLLRGNDLNVRLVRA